MEHAESLMNHSNIGWGDGKEGQEFYKSMWKAHKVWASLQKKCSGVLYDETSLVASILETGESKEVCYWGNIFAMNTYDF